MIYDAALLMASAQASTVAAGSTDYVDTLAAGNDYKGCLFVVQITSSFVNYAGTPTMQFLLQTSSLSTFTDATTSTMAASALYQASQLTAGKMWAVAIPSGAKRYIRGYFNPSASTGSSSFNTTGVNMFILEDIDVEINKRKII